MSAIGSWMLPAGGNDEEEQASRGTSSRGPALIALGISISLDELAVRFTIGLAHLAVTTVIVAIACRPSRARSSVLPSAPGSAKRWRERAEHVAGS